ncbi:MAG: PadR family transcriptional regulator [Oscillospiraceae bacterium]|nr:PadR family transcriptional regulator [Oscillospiraceae bacterium]
MGNLSHTFSAYFKRVATPAIVLAVLSERPMYGYEIVSEIAKRSGGKYTVSIMYPILNGLHKEGYIAEGETVIIEGRARKYYCITPEGTRYLQTVRREFKELSDIFFSFTGGDV